MKLKIIAFGIARDILKNSELKLEFTDSQILISDLKNRLVAAFPDFDKLASLRMAVNEEYVEDSYELQNNDEIVLIPPVSGG